jgi:succinate dehydrogenase / fumarate reductase iron-sulfur subunit
MQKKVIFKIWRFKPPEKRQGYTKYEVPVVEGMTVLDGLLHIKENIDASLTIRYSCRMGVCGSCGMVINGKPDLACHLQISHIRSKVIEVRPLFNHPAVKDLICDFGPFFEKHRMVKPYLIRKDAGEQENPTLEYKQLPQEHLDYMQFSYCLKCGCCYAVCPTAATDELYLGPQAFSAAFRYLVDSRDEGWEERVLAVDTSHGIWRCHFAGSCAQVCPKGVDPGLASQLLKRLVIFGTGRGRAGAGIIEKPVPVPEKIEKIPKPPPATV